jgi:ribonuclease P protein subunit POP4
MDKEKIARDEFIGLQVKISECTDPKWVGKSGLIIDETKNTFTLIVDNQKKMIAKKTATFEFDLNGKKIAIDGKKIAYRPEDRIKKIR